MRKGRVERMLENLGSPNTYMKHSVLIYRSFMVVRM